METQASLETITHPHLRKLLADVAGVTTEAQQLRAHLSDTQLAWKPEPDVWNILECLQHVIMVDGLYFSRILTALHQATREGGAAPFRPSFFGKTFIRFVSPESKRKIKTLRLFAPPPALTDVAVIDQFVDHQDTLSQLIRQADGVDLNRTKFSSPATRLVRFTIGEGLTMLVAHQQRHLQQAHRLTQRPDFPG